MCECGREVFILKTMECHLCYRRRKRAGGTAPTVYTALIPPTNPCSYDVAHQRVAQYRGSASQHVCPCGAQAEHWAYRNTSNGYEIQGTKPSRKSLLKWSSNPTEYDALCIKCHRIRDGKSFSDAASNTPASATQNPSLINPQEAL